MKMRKKENFAVTSKKRFLTSKAMNFIVMSAIFTLCFMCFPCFADGATGATGATGTEALTSAQGLLSKAALAGGGIWAVWGLVQLGMSIKDHNGPGIQGAIWQLVGGAIIIAAGTLISGLNLDMTV